MIPSIAPEALPPPDARIEKTDLAKSIEDSQIQLSGLRWRIVRYAGSPSDIVLEASEHSEAPIRCRFSGMERDYSIQSHLETGKTKILFEGSLKDLNAKLPRAPRLDPLTDLPQYCTPNNFQMIVRHFFQYQTPEGAWINYHTDPRPLSYDQIDTLLKANTSWKEKTIFWRYATYIATGAFFVLLMSFIIP